MTTGRRSQVEGDDNVLMLLDISRAHLHSPLARVVFVMTINGNVHKLLNAISELQDTGASFDRKGACDELDWRVGGQIHRIQEGDEHVGQVGALV